MFDSFKLVYIFQHSSSDSSSLVFNCLVTRLHLSTLVCVFRIDPISNVIIKALSRVSFHLIFPVPHTEDIKSSKITEIINRVNSGINK